MPRPVSTDRFEDAVNGYVTPREDNFKSGASPLESGQRPENRFNGNGNANHNMHQTPSPASLARMLSNAKKHRAGKKVSLRDRICCHQWNWFTMVCMHTPQLPRALPSTPGRHRRVLIMPRFTDYGEQPSRDSAQPPPLLTWTGDGWHSQCAAHRFVLYLPLGQHGEPAVVSV
jgi:hypothetical protein